MHRIRVLGLGLALSAVAAIASPVRVHTLGTKSQAVEMCPDCKSKVACAQVGDYRIGLSGDLPAKQGSGSFTVHLQDKSGKPVPNAKVEVTFSMPKHGHSMTVPAKHRRMGEYVATSNRLSMPGGWEVEVRALLEGGDTVKQRFAYSR